MLLDCLIVQHKIMFVYYLPIGEDSGVERKPLIFILLVYDVDLMSRG